MYVGVPGTPPPFQGVKLFKACRGQVPSVNCRLLLAHGQLLLVTRRLPLLAGPELFGRLSCIVSVK